MNLGIWKTKAAGMRRTENYQRRGAARAESSQDLQSPSPSGFSYTPIPIGLGGTEPPSSEREQFPELIKG